MYYSCDLSTCYATTHQIQTLASKWNSCPIINLTFLLSSLITDLRTLWTRKVNRRTCQSCHGHGQSCKPWLYWRTGLCQYLDLCPKVWALVKKETKILTENENHWVFMHLQLWAKTQYFFWPGTSVQKIFVMLVDYCRECASSGFHQSANILPWWISASCDRVEEF